MRLLTEMELLAVQDWCELHHFPRKGGEQIEDKNQSQASSETPEGETLSPQTRRDSSKEAPPPLGND